MGTTVGRELPEAVVFDCDGTLLDSEQVTTAAMRAELAALGHTLRTEDVAALIGHPWPHTRGYLVDRFGLDQDDVAAYRAAMRRRLGASFSDPDRLFDDTVRVVEQLHEADVPLAVCTSSSRDHVDAVLAMEPLADAITTSVAREDTTTHKPDPTPYLTTITRLGRITGRVLDPRSVVVVEDSWAGVESGVAAGCQVVAVDRGMGLHDLRRAHRLVTELRLDDVLIPPTGT